MNKAAARQEYLNRRLAIPPKERSRLDDLLLIQFQRWQVPPMVQTVLSYWPLQTKAEPNTFLITDFMAFRIPFMQLAYPMVRPDTLEMNALLVNDETEYRKNNYGIAEPVEAQVLDQESIDLVIVPLLAVDRKGYRLGYGKGYYDRFLMHCRPDCFRLGLSYFEPIAAIPSIDAYDIPLNACITPEAFYEF